MAGYSNLFSRYGGTPGRLGFVYLARIIIANPLLSWGCCRCLIVASTGPFSIVGWRMLLLRACTTVAVASRVWLLASLIDQSLIVASTGRLSIVGRRMSLLRACITVAVARRAWLLANLIDQTLIVASIGSLRIV